jgi:hypothetical protein
MFPAFASAWLVSLISLLHWVDKALIDEDEEPFPPSDCRSEIPDSDG